MHNQDSFANVPEDAQYFVLAEPMLESCVEKVNESAAGTILHQDKYFPTVAHKRGSRRFHKVHDRFMSTEPAMILDFATHTRKRILVPYAHVLENESSVAVLVTWNRNRHVGFD